ncbi:MAG TPA: flavodoxin-dependent (E)-4-hydroxy-3-methylbut-2-enyl-diphosphate synthase [Planctomycetota bacterium]|nr:flavodoxin-dependent (E)-4-hydroxy-3-methylbut-2-enyl-diphosphate synthase [Planctomycetota bacterium]
MKRRQTRTVRLGRIRIGSGHPVSVQGMTKTHTADVEATVRQIRELALRGCDIVRVAVPRTEDADAIAAIRKEIDGLPLVADVHFDHRLAIRALEAGADGVRINPGNLRDMDAVAEVVHVAAHRDACIRIGVNSGSIRPRDDDTDADIDLAELLAGKTLEYLEFVESLDFTNVKLSLKASDVPTTLQATRLAAEACDAPLHIGITAAGPPRTSLVRSAVGIGTLLAGGIGDTVRVSMTGSPVEEVTAACDILETLELRERTRPRIISCPTCGRCEIDLARVVDEVERRLPADAPAVSIAVMGCVVNGPGEAAEADVGIAGGKGFGYLFRRGEKVRRVEEHEMVDALVEEVMKLKAAP